MARIMIIDDEAQIRNALQLLLERHGYEVFEAHDGEKGLNLCRTVHADLIITDIIMEQKEGLETIRELRQEYPEVKIIAMSGGGNIDPSEYLFLAERFGAHYTLSKPFSSDELLEAVKRLLIV